MLRRPGLRCGAGGDTSEAAFDLRRAVCPRPQWGGSGDHNMAPPVSNGADHSWSVQGRREGPHILKPPNT